MARVLNGLMWILAIGFGLYPVMVWFIPDDAGLLSSKPLALLRDPVWRTEFYTHITFGGLALLAGVSQFSRPIRARHPGIHRTLGNVYMVSCLLSGSAGVAIAGHATGGVGPQWGFSLLAVAWLVSTGTAWHRIRKGQPNAHQRWMIRSYALTFAAVTLRLWLPLFTGAIGMDFLPAYRIIAWLCWVPNLLLAEWWIRAKWAPSLSS